MYSLKTFLSGEKPVFSPLNSSWLLLGGTGAISTALTALLRSNHASVTCLNRGNHPLPSSVAQILCDVRDDAAMDAALKGKRYDVVVDFLTFTPEQAEKRIAQFQGKCGRYIFISTAMTYEKPPRSLFITERTPQNNPYSDYAQKKLRCEAVFRAAHKSRGFPLTIIRPSCTYGERRIPFILVPPDASWTLLTRLRAGKPVIVPGDGSVFWTITHNSDFARALFALMHNPDSLGEDFHITQDECMTWDAFAAAIAREAGAPAPRIIHVASDALIREKPSLAADLLGDKAQTAVFDNSKLRQFAPGFQFLTSFREGVRGSIRFLDTHPEHQIIDAAWDAWMDELAERWG